MQTNSCIEVLTVAMVTYTSVLFSLKRYKLFVLFLRPVLMNLSTAVGYIGIFL